MKEERMVKQQAQDNASARSLNTLLLGQITPRFVSLPVLKKNLYQPANKSSAISNFDGYFAFFTGFFERSFLVSFCFFNS